MKDTTEIGVAQMKWAEDGSLIAAHFIPATQSIETKSIDTQLKDMANDLSVAEADDIRKNAFAVMSSWFSLITQIELADRQDFKISYKVTKRETWPSGVNKECHVRFKQIKTAKS